MREVYRFVFVSELEAVALVIVGIGEHGHEREPELGRVRTCVCVPLQTITGSVCVHREVPHRVDIEPPPRVVCRKDDLRDALADVVAGRVEQSGERIRRWRVLANRRRDRVAREGVEPNLLIRSRGHSVR